MREFRAHHDEFEVHGIPIACITRETPPENRKWKERLEVPFAILSDGDGAAARAFGAVRSIAMGPWKLDLVRRTTVLIDGRGEIAAVWGKGAKRGHAKEVLELAKLAGVSRSSP